MTDRDWNWNDNCDWLRSPESGDDSQTDCESSESHEQTQAKTDESTHSQTIHRRALLQTGLVALGFTGATSLSQLARAADAGDQEWAFEADEEVSSSPTVADGTVYVGSEDDNLYAVDATAGEQQWGLETGTDFASSPTVADGTVYVGSFFGGTLHAVDATTGEQQWAFETSDNVRSSPTVADGTVYIGCSDGTLHAVDATTGEQQWAFEADGRMESSPTVADGTVYVGSYGRNLYAVDAATGTQQWTFETSDTVLSSPTVADGTVYVGSWDNNLYAVDAGTGAQQWAFETGARVDSSPTVADGTVYVGSWDNNLYAVDAGTGAQQWAFETGDRVDSSPTVADDTVYVGSWDNNLYAVDAATGTQQWAFETGDRVESSPTVADGTVYVGSDDYDLYAVDAGVEGSSEGSRVRLRTLGHHDENIGQPPGGGGELDLSVQAGTAPPGGTYTLTYQITNTGSTTIGDGNDNSPAVIPGQGFPGVVTNEGGIPDGGAVDGVGWYAWTIDPGETLEANLEVELPDDIDPGEYEFTAVATQDQYDEDREYDQASGTVTVTVEESEFDPTVHGFGFVNYRTPDLPGFGETIAFVEDVVLTELRQLRGLDVEVLEQLTLAGAIYTAQEGGLTNGHCLGMVFTAREYYNTGIPADELESYTPSTEQKLGVTIQTPPQTAADLVDNPENTPALNPVEVAIDNRQQTQIFDSTYVLRYLAGIAAPQTGVGSLNETEVLTAVKQQTDAGKTAPLGLLKTIESSHVVLAYDVTISVPENETAIENARSVEVSVYDPNDPLSEFPLLIFDRPTADDEFSMSEYQFGSTESDDPITAQKAIYLEEVDPDYQFFTDGAATDGFATALSEGLGSFLSVGVMSPVTVSVTRPDGRSLREVPVSAEELTQQTDTDYEEFHVGLGVSPGEYEIELTGTDAGEYTVEVTGATTNGGQINDSFTKEISAEETQTLTATVPDQDSESGTVTPPDSETDISVTRTVSSDEVAPGEEVTVTTEIPQASGGVSTTSSYEPPVSEATIQSVTVGGASGDPIISEATANGSTVTLGDVGSDVTVTVTESLTVGEQTDVTHEITGEVTAGETTTEVDPVSVTVADIEPQSVVDEYDTDDDGTISITELGAAGADFARGELSITELGRLGAEFAS